VAESTGYLGWLRQIRWGCCVPGHGHTDRPVSAMVDLLLPLSDCSHSLSTHLSVENVPTNPKQPQRPPFLKIPCYTGSTRRRFQPCRPALRFRRVTETARIKKGYGKRKLRYIRHISHDPTYECSVLASWGPSIDVRFADTLFLVAA